jgi:hypothetical protein
MVVTGGFKGNIDFGLGPLPGNAAGAKFLVKLDGTGRPLWNHSYGEEQLYDAASVSVDPSDAVTTVGSFSTAIDFGQGSVLAKGGLDVYVAKFAGATGALLHAKTYGDSQDQHATAVGVDTTGDAYVGGWYQGVLDFGDGPLSAVSPGAGDLFVAKLPP